MAKLNSKANKQKARPAPKTHEGGPAVRPNRTINVTLTKKGVTTVDRPMAKLRRSVLACLLWEDEFYEDGKSIASRIENAARQVPLVDLANLAVEARSVYNLRHAPLLLTKVLVARASEESKTAFAGVLPLPPHFVESAVASVIQRADELTELLALYWKDGRRPLSKQLQKGLARAFTKFDAYQLAKYDREGSVRLRDVLFLAHPKPKDEAQQALWDKIAAGTLEPPLTWEVELSKGADKRETFERLLAEGKLGYLALLRNLRNMAQAGVDDQLIIDAILARKGAHRVLPFRFTAAARAVPKFEPYLDQAFVAGLRDMPALPGKTVILVDVSWSMAAPLSGKSDLSRMDAAATLASIIPGDVRVFTFSNRLAEVPPRKGMAGVDAVRNSQTHEGTYLAMAVAALGGGRITQHDRYGSPTSSTTLGRVEGDRLIVLTDEQSHDLVPAPSFERAYMVNVASAKNGVGYGKPWVHLDGFSENLIRWIGEYEKSLGSEGV